MDETNSGRDTFSLSWKTLAIASLALNGVAVAVVATLSVRNSVDALATVALALAVIAFVCQLIIYAIQTSHSGAQLAQAREINGTTVALLAEARTRIENTNQMVTQHHGELMAMMSSKGRSADPPASDELSDVGTHTQVAGTTPAGSGDTPAVKASDDPPVPELDAEIVEAMRTYATWPESGEVENLLAPLEALDRNYSVFTFDISLDLSGLMQGQKARSFDLFDSEIPLLDAGWLIETASRVDPVEGPKRRARLSDTGRRHARLLTAPWPPQHLDTPLTARLWAVRSRMPKELLRDIPAAVEEMILNYIPN